MRRILALALLFCLAPLPASGGVKRYFSQRANGNSTTASSAPVEYRYFYVADTLGDLQTVTDAQPYETGIVGSSTYRWDGASWVEVVAGSGAPTGAHYLTTQAESGLDAETVVTAAGLALLDDADAAAQRTTLGLGSLATQSGTVSGTNTGDQTITLTGAVTGSGTGTFATTLATLPTDSVGATQIATDGVGSAEIAANGVGSSELADGAVDTAAITDANVTYAKIQNVTTNRLLGRQTAGSGVVEELDPSNAINGTEIVRRRGRVTIFDDMLNSVAAPFTVTSSTGSTAVQALDTNNRPGVARMTTAGSATGRTSPGIGVASVSVGQGAIVYEAAVNPTLLSTSAERYQLVIGLFDTQTAANQVDGAYFLYDEGGVSTGSAASANWQQVTVSNSTRTFTTTSTAVAQATWTTLRIEINAAGNLVTFYINGTATGTTHNANIPTGTARATGMGILLIKSVGTTARTVDIDYIAFDEALTTSR